MIDPICQAFVGLEPCETPEAEPYDPLQKFLEQAPLAGALGRNGWRFVAALEESSQEWNRRAERILLAPRAETLFGKVAATAQPSGWDEPVSTDHSRLEKSGDRRRSNLRQWLRTELALGKNVAELVAHAERHDAATARLLAEIGEELEAA